MGVKAKKRIFAQPIKQNLAKFGKQIVHAKVTFEHRTARFTQWIYYEILMIPRNDGNFHRQVGAMPMHDEYMAHAKSG
jgi:hypothetical protein